MNNQDLKKFNIPDSPGAYMFLKKKLQARSSKPQAQDSERILYIGKATSLKDRVKSYFSKDIGISRSLLIEGMVKEAHSIDWVETDSVLEALILEANLIKKYKPKYNTKEKDDKSFNFVVISKEDFPRVFTMRGREIQNNLKAKSYKLKAIYGPYPQGSSLKEALKIIRKIFPFRGEKDPVKTKKGVSTLNEEIGIVPRFRIGEVSKKDYQKTINNIRLFFEGKKSKIINELKKEMKENSQKENFEKAALIRNQIFALEHINDIALMKSGFYEDDQDKSIRIEAYDIAHLGETNRVGVMVSFLGNEPDKKHYRRFKINTNKKGDTAALAEVVERRLSHPEWPLPKIIVVDGGKAQINAAERVLKLYGSKIPVVSVVKDDKHKAREIMGDKDLRLKYEIEIIRANSEAHRFALKYHREKRRKF